MKTIEELLHMKFRGRKYYEGDEAKHHLLVNGNFEKFKILEGETIIAELLPTKSEKGGIWPNGAKKIYKVNPTLQGVVDAQLMSDAERMNASNGTVVYGARGGAYIKASLDKKFYEVHYGENGNRVVEYTKPKREEIEKMIEFNQKKLLDIDYVPFRTKEEQENINEKTKRTLNDFVNYSPTIPVPISDYFFVNKKTGIIMNATDVEEGRSKEFVAEKFFSYRILSLGASEQENLKYYVVLAE